MMQEASYILLLFLLSVSTVISQSESMCPSNAGMGLCTDLPNSCISDNDCSNGEICCPESCGRTCKSRYTSRAASEGSVPDLLNDPRVYVGKCSDASCYSMFGGEPNECSTSKLCPRGQFCCNDGCKNVCQWKPEYAAAIAQEQTRARLHQEMVVQKQQMEMRRRQQEMYTQRQRQLASNELARKQAEARATAEAELLAHQKRASFEANLRAVAGSRAKLASMRKEQTVAQPYLNKQQPSYQDSLPSGPSSDFLNNFGSNPQTNSTTFTTNGSLAQQQVPSIDISRGLTPTKKDNLLETFSKHINSPANVNPHNLLSQQTVARKAAEEGPLSSSQSAVPSSGTQLTRSNTETASVNQIMTNPQRYPAKNLESLNSRPQTSVLRTYPTHLPHQSQSFNPNQNVYSDSSNAVSNFANKYFPPQAQNNRPSNPYQNRSPTQTGQQFNSITNVQRQSPQYTNQQRAFSPPLQSRSPTYFRQQPYVPNQNLQQRLSYLAQNPGRVYQGQQQQQQQQSGASPYRDGYQQGGVNPYVMYEMMQTVV
ncbi:hypothetical protein BsWGS_28701 [Bradybaena similaris]